jgi:hypothetical protein
MNCVKAPVETQSELVWDSLAHKSDTPSNVQCNFAFIYKACGTIIDDELTLSYLCRGGHFLQQLRCASQPPGSQQIGTAFVP